MDNLSPAEWVPAGSVVAVVLFVARWLLAQQRDVFDRYRLRVAELETRQDELEAARERDRIAARRRYRYVVRAVRKCESREATLLHALAAAGVPIPAANAISPSYLEAYPDDDEDDGPDPDAPPI